MIIKLLSDLARIPTRATDGSAGYDLYSTEDYTLGYGERKLFKTNIVLEIPKGIYGRIAPRSGLALKQGLDVMAGVIDSDYRNDIGVILINLKKEWLEDETFNKSMSLILKREITGPSLEEQNIEIKKGDKIAQIIFEPCLYFNFVQGQELTETERGLGGFGSTDKVLDKGT